MPRLHFKNSGRTIEQDKDHYADISFTAFARLDKPSFTCPVCGRLTNGLRNEGYMHRAHARAKNKETTYCKPVKSE